MVITDDMDLVRSVLGDKQGFAAPLPVLALVHEALKRASARGFRADTRLISGALRRELLAAVGSGHYTAFARGPQSPQWFYYNDSAQPLPVDDGRVLAASAYMLFYEQ